MSAYEQTLRSECAYKGAQPYWDEPLDAGHFSTASIFSPTLGFGGNGSGPLACITTGPFANYTLTVGPGYRNIPHCIWRQFNDAASFATEQKYIDRCLELGTYAEAWPCIENGLMPGDVPSSPPPGFLEGLLPPWPPGGQGSPFPPGDGTGPPGGGFAVSPHNGGHVGVGGEMGNPVSSPGGRLSFVLPDSCLRGDG